MSETFDPYKKWFGIPPSQQPPNHYRLLGVSLFESDAEVIGNAADQRVRYLRGLETGEYAEHAQRLIEEVAAARICLLDPTARAAYDVELQAPATAPPLLPPTAPAAIPEMPVAQAPPPISPTGATTIPEMPVAQAPPPISPASEIE